MIFLQYILPSIIAFVSAVIVSLVSYFQYKSKVKKEIEKLEKEYQLLNKDHVKKIHYETTFAIYKELSDKLFTMSVDVLSLFYPGLDISIPLDTEEKQKVQYKKYNQACDSFNYFTKTLYANSPFIEKDVFDKLMDYRNMCNEQIIWYPDLILNVDKSLSKENCNEKNKCYKRSEEINRKLYECIEFLRVKIKNDEYLNNER